jgi:hypothetical protein
MNKLGFIYWENRPLWSVWGRFEYINRSPVCRKTRLEGNPVLGDVTWPPCPWWIQIGHGLPDWGSWIWEKEMIVSSGELGPENDCTSEEPAATLSCRILLSSERATRINSLANCLILIKTWQMEADGYLRPRLGGQLADWATVRLAYWPTDHRSW